MLRRVSSALLLAAAFAPVQAQVPWPSAADAQMQKIQGEVLQPTPPPEGKPDPAIPHGEFLHSSITDSKIYPGTENGFEVYIPAQYDPAKPACLLVKLDGMGAFEGNVLDSLIAKKEAPIIIGVGIDSGVIWKDPPGTPKRRADRFNRSYEFDSMNDHFPDYVLNELLPAVQKLKTHDGRAINLSPDGNDHAAMGASTGGIGSFTLAWRRPDQFTRIFDSIGTFVSIAWRSRIPGADSQDRAQADPHLFGRWLDRRMESSFWFLVRRQPQHGVSPQLLRLRRRPRLGHPCARWPRGGRNFSRRHALALARLPGAHRGRDFAKQHAQGNPHSRRRLTKIPQVFQSAAGLAANAGGDVYLSDAPAATIDRLGADDKPTVFLDHAPAVIGQAFGPDGTLFGVVPADKKIIALGPQGATRTVADGIAGHGIVVTHDGTLYVSEPGRALRHAQPDMADQTRRHQGRCRPGPPFRLGHRVLAGWLPLLRGGELHEMDLQLRHARRWHVRRQAAVLLVAHDRYSQ